MAETTIQDLFTADPGRAERLTINAAGLTVDFSKNLIDDTTLTMLTALADASGVEALRDFMIEFRDRRARL